MAWPLNTARRCGRKSAIRTAIDKKRLAQSSQTTFIIAMHHSPGFLKLVDESRSRVREITPEQARERLAKNPGAALLDVREDLEWRAGHAAQAVHLGKGILERDIEQEFPD